MKRNIIRMLALALALGMLAGCAGNASNSTPASSSSAPADTTPVSSGTETPAEAERVELIVTAGAAGGAWYLFGAAFNDVWETQIPGVKTTLIPGSGKSNPLLVSEGKEAQVGFCYINMSGDAYNGKGEFTIPASDMCSMMSLNTIQYLTAIVDKKLDISTFSEIKEKKPALLIAPGGSEQLFKDVLNAHGITYEDIEAWGGRIDYLGASDGANSFKDGHINVLSNCAPQPYTPWVEVAAARDVVVLPVEDYAVEALNALNYQFGTIDTTTYKDPTGDIVSCGPTTNLIVNKDLDEELVYQLTKTLCESMEKLIATNPSLAVFDVSHAPDSTIPLHPGAERYFKEIGVL